MRKRVNSMYQESGITEATSATRETLSTVTSILFCVSAFELYYIRPEILSNRYAFTIPAVAAVGTSDYPVYLPDMFLLLTSSFWSPALTWVFTSILVPSAFGYFFNLNANSQNGPRTRARAINETVVDLTLSTLRASPSAASCPSCQLFASTMPSTVATEAFWLAPPSLDSSASTMLP